MRGTRSGFPTVLGEENSEAFPNGGTRSGFPTVRGDENWEAFPTVFGEENWDSIAGVPLMEHSGTQAGGKMRPVTQHSCDRLLASHLLVSVFLLPLPSKKKKKKKLSQTIFLLLLQLPLEKKLWKTIKLL